MRLNKHLFISCFHKTDGEVILCSGRRNYFKSLHGGILLPGPALLGYEPDGTHLIAISSLEHLGRMSGPGWEHYPGVILLCGCWGCSLIPLFSHGHGSIGVSTTQFIMNVSVPFAGSLIYLQFLEQKKFCSVNTVYLPCSMQLDCVCAALVESEGHFITDSVWKEMPLMRGRGQQAGKGMPHIIPRIFMCQLQ